jgi:uncharacterized protein YbgA (DUF1722 family)
VRFHTSLKMTLMAHSPAHYQELGQWVAKGGRLSLGGAERDLHSEVMEGLQLLANPAKHAT